MIFKPSLIAVMPHRFELARTATGRRERQATTRVEPTCPTTRLCLRLTPTRILLSLDMPHTQPVFTMTGAHYMVNMMITVPKYRATGIRQQIRMSVFLTPSALLQFLTCSSLYRLMVMLHMDMINIRIDVLQPLSQILMAKILTAATTHRAAMTPMLLIRRMHMTQMHTAVYTPLTRANKHTMMPGTTRVVLSIRPNINLHGRCPHGTEQDGMVDKHIELRPKSIDAPFLSCRDPGPSCVVQSICSTPASTYRISFHYLQVFPCLPFLPCV